MCAAQDVNRAGREADGGHSQAVYGQEADAADNVHDQPFSVPQRKVAVVGCPRGPEHEGVAEIGRLESGVDGLDSAVGQAIDQGAGGVVSRFGWLVSRLDVAFSILDLPGHHGGVARIAERDQEGDDAERLWKGIVTRGGNVSVFDTEANGYVLQPVASENDLAQFIGDKDKRKYIFVLSETKENQQGLVHKFALMEIKRLAKWPLFDHLQRKQHYV